MTEKKRTLLLNDNALSKVVGGGDVKTIERYYCPRCGAQTAMKLKGYIDDTIDPFGTSVRVKDACYCSRCDWEFDPFEMRDSPNTYWHLNTKSF
ncbi:hypothetical protein [Paratractidigestivibacter sp.]|uniref:hypothetical protein n=1 Tax=Paratractidigestivibacter sp. TaxID=2847316 RepID=UPI002ABE3124|nr:hypothetical protein [Paratractidigestivibacter sp.]